LLARLGILAITRRDDCAAGTHRQARTARTSRARLPGDLCNLPGAAARLGGRTDLVIADSHCRFLVPTVVSHRVGKQSLNRTLGFVINGITTLALIGSVILLVRALPGHRESAVRLLRSGGLLWLTNVIVFALWYWRLDGGGPTLRQQEKKFGSKSFLFPQMQIPHDERGQFACARWRPRFVDYLFVAFTQSSTFGPTDSPLLARWAKILAMVQILISLTIVVLLISQAVGVL
jgi:hypothetical protein